MMIEPVITSYDANEISTAVVFTSILPSLE